MPLITNVGPIFHIVSLAHRQVCRIDRVGHLHSVVGTGIQIDASIRQGASRQQEQQPQDHYSLHFLEAPGSRITFHENYRGNGIICLCKMPK